MKKLQQTTFFRNEIACLLQENEDGTWSSFVGLHRTHRYFGNRFFVNGDEKFYAAGVVMENETLAAKSWFAIGNDVRESLEKATYRITNAADRL